MLPRSHRPLKDKDNEIVVPKQVWKMNNSEIARKLGVTEGAIRHQLRRIAEGRESVRKRKSSQLDRYGEVIAGLVYEWPRWIQNSTSPLICFSFDSISSIWGCQPKISFSRPNSRLSPPMTILKYHHITCRVHSAPALSGSNVIHLNHLKESWSSSFKTIRKKSHCIQVSSLFANVPSLKPSHRVPAIDQHILPPFLPPFSPSQEVSILAGQMSSSIMFSPPGSLPHYLYSQQFKCFFTGTSGIIPEKTYDQMLQKIIEFQGLKNISRICRKHAIYQTFRT